MDIVINTKMRFRKEQWKQIILDREATGLSVAAWCKQNVLQLTKLSRAGKTILRKTIDTIQKLRPCWPGAMTICNDKGDVCHHY